MGEIPSEFFSDWVTPDIVGKGLDVEIIEASNEIQSIQIEERTVQSLRSKVKYKIKDVEKEASFRINKTNARRISDVLETRDAEKWVGHRLHLDVVKVLVNKKQKDSMLVTKVDDTEIKE